MDACGVCEGTGVLLRDACPLCDGTPAVAKPEAAIPPPSPLAQPGDGSDDSTEGPSSSGMAGLAATILADLRQYRPVTVPGMDPSLHYLAPHIPKVTWDALGDLVAARERASACNVNVHGSLWISLRLDGSGFSKAVRMLRRHGILEPEGFSDRFAGCMQACLRSLMAKFNCLVGYTQSDEMIVFIPPANVVRGKQMPHTHGGRVTKLTTLAAGFVTSQFVVELSTVCWKSGASSSCFEGLARVLPHFDCRLGHYESWEEARALLMWRAYDCSVNGISDAVYHTKGSGRTIQSLGKREKLEWLWKAGKLPLPRHQAYGTVLVRGKRVVEGFNPKTKEAVIAVRGVVDHVDGSVLELLRKDTLFPEGVEA
jgi:tRNA(His) 5'-end guanylyltransferase